MITFDPDSKDRRLVCPLFHYRLGVLYEEKRNLEKARQQYEKFLDICGQADPRLEETAEARRRLSQLGS